MNEWINEWMNEWSFEIYTGVKIMTAIPGLHKINKQVGLYWDATKNDKNTFIYLFIWWGGGGGGGVIIIYIQPQIRKSWDSMENANKKRK